MRFSVKLLICLTSFAVCESLFSIDSYAQRQTPGRSSVEGYGSFVGGYGGGVALSNYGFSGRTYFGLDLFNRMLDINFDPVVLDEEEVLPGISYKLPSWEVLATGGYLWRAFSNRSRSFILSAGLGIGLGVRYCPAMKTIEYKDYTFGTVGFLCCFMPEIQLECFPARNVSLFGSFRPKLCPWDTLGGSYVGWLSLQAAFGIKYYI